MVELAPLIRDLAMMLGVASIVMIIFHKIKQPVVLGYLISGIIIGPYTPPFELISDVNAIKTLSELGIIFLMFSLGLEFSFRKLTKIGTSATMTGLVEVVLMIGVGFITGEMLGWPFYDSLFLAAALSISSTTIIVKAFEEFHLKKQVFAQLVFGVLIIEDLIAILLLVAISLVVATNSLLSVTLLQAFVRLIIVVGSWFLVGYLIVPPLIARVKNLVNQETLTIISIALCLFLVNIAASYHYSVALGAFIMGSILAETSLVHRIAQLIRPIRDIFAAVFFMSVGMLINPHIIFNHWFTVLIISLVAIVGKILTTSIGALISGQEFGVALQSGFAMAQIGEFSFIIAALGISLGVTNNEFYPMIVAVSAITTFTTPYLIRFSSSMSESVYLILPSKMKQFVNNYSHKSLDRAKVVKKGSLASNYVLRLVINGIVVAMLFSLVEKFIVPYGEQLLKNSELVDIISWVLSVIISAPFIWAMLFSYELDLQQPLKTQKTKLIIWLGRLMTLSEVILLSFAYTYVGLLLVVLFILAAVLLIVFSKYLKAIYCRFENNVVKNISKTLFISPQSERDEESEVQPIEIIVVHIKGDHPHIGKSLTDKVFLTTLKGSIVGLERNGKRIFHIDASIQLQDLDILYVIKDD